MHAPVRTHYHYSLSITLLQLYTPGKMTDKSKVLKILSFTKTTEIRLK